MFKRIIGVLLVIIAIVSLLFSVVATFAVWNYRQPMAEAATAGLQLLDETLGTTVDAFVTVEEALATANSSVASAQDTFKSLSLTITSSNPTLDSLAGFLAEGLPNTLKSTGRTLDAAAQSAQVIDGVLETLSSIPLLNIAYDPQMPLSDTLAGIGESLNALPDALGDLGGNLSGTSATLPALAKNLDELGGSIGELTTSLTSAEQVVASYKGLIGRYQAAIRSLEAFIPTIVSIGPIIFTFFVFWLAVVQLAALLKGWEWLRGREPEPEAVVTATMPAPAAVVTGNDNDSHAAS